MKMIIYKAGDADSHKQLGKQLAELPPGEYMIKITKNRAIRSLDQNAYYWVILTIIAISTGEYDKDTLHETCKKKFNGHMVQYPKSGMEMQGKSTSGLDTIQFSAYVNRVKQWAQDEWGIIIPEKKDIDYARWMEIENNYNEHFSGF